jgi:hypothetical protein
LEQFARATPLNSDLCKVNSALERRAGERGLEEGDLMTERLLREQKRDGFYLRKNRFELPLDNGALDPKTQLDLLICHLFINNKHSIASITRIGIDPPTIVRALLEQGVICERRQRSRAA